MATNPKPQAPWGEYVPFVGYMTAEQFAFFPGDDGWNYELHQGRLIAMPRPGKQHAKIQERFFLTLGLYIRNNNLGSLDGTGCYNLPLPNNTEEVLCPDLSYVTPAREASMQIRGSYPVGAPDLVIEIASPNDTHPALTAKAITYLQASVQLIWIVWPNSQTIELWQPTSPLKPTATLRTSDMLDGLSIIPGFRCPVQDIFTL